MGYKHPVRRANRAYARFQTVSARRALRPPILFRVLRRGKNDRIELPVGFPLGLASGQRRHQPGHIVRRNQTRHAGQGRLLRRLTLFIFAQFPSPRTQYALLGQRLSARGALKGQSEKSFFRPGQIHLLHSERFHPPFAGGNHVAHKFFLIHALYPQRKGYGLGKGFFLHYGLFAL